MRMAEAPPIVIGANDASSSFACSIYQARCCNRLYERGVVAWDGHVLNEVVLDPIRERELCSKACGTKYSIAEMNIGGELVFESCVDIWRGDAIPTSTHKHKIQRNIIDYSTILKKFCRSDCDSVCPVSLCIIDVSMMLTLPFSFLFHGFTLATVGLFGRGSLLAADFQYNYVCRKLATECVHRGVLILRHEF